jgi:hypothetical protein
VRGPSKESRVYCYRRHDAPVMTMNVENAAITVAAFVQNVR